MQLLEQFVLVLLEQPVKLVLLLVGLLLLFLLVLEDLVFNVLLLLVEPSRHPHLLLVGQFTFSLLEQLLDLLLGS